MHNEKNEPKIDIVTARESVESIISFKQARKELITDYVRDLANLKQSDKQIGDFYYLGYDMLLAEAIMELKNNWKGRKFELKEARKDDNHERKEKRKYNKKLRKEKKYDFTEAKNAIEKSLGERKARREEQKKPVEKSRSQTSQNTVAQLPAGQASLPQLPKVTR